MILAIAILISVAGCATVEPGETTKCESKNTYTHEELTALPGDQLLALFIANGLITNDSLKATFTEEELQALFKSEFDFLCEGITSRSDLMYFDLADETKKIYKKIVKQD